MKKSHKSLIVITIFSLMISGAFAQTAASSAQAASSGEKSSTEQTAASSDEKSSTAQAASSSDEIVIKREILKTMARNKIVSGNFIQKRTIAKTGRSFKLEGFFTVCQKGIIWDGQKPVHSTTIITNTKLLQIDSRGKETTIQGEAGTIYTTISRMMTSLFTGDAAGIAEFFETNLISQNQDSGDLSSWTLELLPKDTTISQVLKSITLKGSKDYLLSMEALQQNGDSVSYDFYDHKVQLILLPEQEALFEK